VTDRSRPATGTWTLLAGAIGAEVTATLSLRAAIDHTGWVPLVVAGYLTAFILLGLTLRAGLPVGVAYGVWGAAGVALTALFGALLFAEVLSVTSVLGIGLIIVGVLLVETGARAGVRTP